MKVTVTQLKAPWPAGTVVGQVIDLHGCAAVPAWADGKCKPAPDDAEAAHVWTRPEAKVVDAKPVESSAAEDLQAAQALLAEAQTEADELRARVAKAEEALAQRDAELAEARAALAKAEEALAAKSTGGKAAKG